MNKPVQVDYEKKYKTVIIALSVLIPLVVALLFRVKIEGYNTDFLPPVYAAINAATAIMLVLAVMAIRNGKRFLHESLMKVSILFSIVFLLLYVIRHMTSDSTPYGGEGLAKTIYLFILITHILLSVVIIPLVLFTYVKAWSGKFEQHKKWAKITFPLWFYVAASGVVVYWMISPYY